VQTFRCACGARIFFENSQCVACGRELGFIASAGTLSAIEPTPDGIFRALLDGSRHRKCDNYVAQGVCNWLVPEQESNSLCQACRLNRVVPDLSQPDSRAKWAEVESAKRRLLYTLNALGLAALPQSESAAGLTFDIKADTPEARVITGHSDGLITLNLAEADPVLREKARVEMAERYRTLLGHFRHEVGHYYWDLRVRDTAWLGPFRELFGDERVDYADALRAHYAGDGGAVWQREFVSSYASAHPWEDWAETWAHYLHITDTLETAQHFGLTGFEPGFEPGAHADQPLDPMLDAWGELTVALNAMNRSMGMPDPYPFQLTAPVIEKLTLVHRVIVQPPPARPDST